MPIIHHFLVSDYYRNMCIYWKKVAGSILFQMFLTHLIEWTRIWYPIRSLKCWKMMWWCRMYVLRRYRIRMSRRRIIGRSCISTFLSGSDGWNPIFNNTPHSDSSQKKLWIMIHVSRWSPRAPKNHTKSFEGRGQNNMRFLNGYEFGEISVLYFIWNFLDFILILISF